MGTRARIGSRLIVFTALLAPAMHATVCTFDDLPAVQAGSEAPIPSGYCGINWYGENGGYYFTNSFQYLGTFNAHSQPNATALFSANQYGLGFITPSVFNGFWAVPNSNYFSNPNWAQLQIQVILSLNGTTVYTSPFTAVTSATGAFISSGYTGTVDSVVINSLGYYAKYGQYTAGGFFSIDDVTYNAVCGNPAISPNTLQNFPTAGGTGSVAVTYAFGCPWTATSGSSWITITSAASGAGNGSVSYQVDANPPGGGYREGSLTVAGLSLPIQEAGTVQFQATGGTSNGGSGTTDVISGSTLSYNGSTWPIAMGQISVQDSDSDLPPATYAPPNFSDSQYKVTFPFSSNPPCVDTITATVGAISQSVTLTGNYLGKVVFDDDPNGYQAGKQFCQSKTFTDASDFFKIQVSAGTSLAVETYPSTGGSAFFVNDQEAVLTPAIYILTNPGQTITFPLSGGRSSTVSADATSPLPASLLQAPDSATPVTVLPQSPSGYYLINGNLQSSKPIVLDNAVVYVSGNVDLGAGIGGMGAIFATGNTNVTGPVTLVPAGEGAPLFVATGNVSISAPAKTGSCTTPAMRGAPLLMGGRLQFHPHTDINGDGTVDTSDIQQEIAQSLGTAAPTNDLTGGGSVGPADVQVVINAALVASCPAQ